MGCELTIPFLCLCVYLRLLVPPPPQFCSNLQTALGQYCHALDSDPEGGRDSHTLLQGLMNTNHQQQQDAGEDGCLLADYNSIH